MDSFCAGGVRAPGEAPAPPPAARNTDHTVVPGVPPKTTTARLSRPLMEVPRNLRPRSSRDKRSAPTCLSSGRGPRDPGEAARTPPSHTAAPTVGVPCTGACGARQLLSAGPRRRGGEGQAARGARPGSPSCHGCRGSVRTLQVQLTQLCGRGPDAQPLAPESRSPPLSLTSTRTKLQTQRPASECRAQSEARWRVWRRKARGTAPRRQAAAGQGRRSRGRPEFPRGAWLCCP